MLEQWTDMSEDAIVDHTDRPRKPTKGTITFTRKSRSTIVHHPIRMWPVQGACRGVAASRPGGVSLGLPGSYDLRS